ncbi:hypothetical protein D3C87_278840 [compost metagenome]
MQIKILLTKAEVEKAILSYIANKGYNVQGGTVEMLPGGEVDVSLDKIDKNTINADTLYR